MQSESFFTAVRVEARRLGFDHCHITRVTEAPHADFFDAWLNAGRAGEMTYLARNQEKRRSPALLANPGDPEFRSMIVLGVNYHQFDLPPEVRDDPSRGVIAAYAWGDDYHEIIRPLLYELDAFIRGKSGRTTLGKCLVDSGPVLERDWAMVAGVGFGGKNCCTIHPLHGSWLLLATLLVPEDLAPTVEPGATGMITVASGAPPSTQDVLAGLCPNVDYGTWRLVDPQSPGGDLLATCGRCTRCLDRLPD
jgi:epoxyqueuosine reductase